MFYLTNQQRTKDIFQGLMAQDTVNPPGNEMRAAEYLRRTFEAEGIKCTIQNLGENRANFIAEIGEGKPVFELSGHLDVVPCYGSWCFPPLKSTEKNGKFYGRGACDMKGGVASMCAAALSMHAAKITFKGTLRLAFVADEEHVNKGMLAFLREYPPADWSVIGEPTELQIAIAHRGTARHYIDIHGVSHHAALVTGEDSAVVKAAYAILAIDELNEKLRKIKHPILRSPTIVVTQLQGYEKDNVVPGNVRLLTDYRLLPGTTEKQVQEQIRQTLQASGIERYTLVRRHFMNGASLSTDDPFVRRCSAIVERVTGQDNLPCAFEASCEQSLLLDAGVKTIICGPGSLQQAHRVNEYVPCEQLYLATELYIALIQDFLMENKDE